MSTKKRIHSMNEYRIQMSTCFAFNFAGRVAVRIQPYTNKFRVKIRGAIIDFDNELCYFMRGHTQQYTFSELIYAIEVFNLASKIILDCYKDTFKPEDFTYSAMNNDFDLDLMSFII